VVYYFNAKTPAVLSPDRNVIFARPFSQSSPSRCLCATKQGYNPQLYGHRDCHYSVNHMNYPPPIPRLGVAAITENLLKRKWSATILRYLEKGISDPAEITKREVNISTKVMSERLRTMLRYGLLARFPRPSPSTVIEYRLTPLGRKLLEMINAIDELDQELIKSRKSLEENFAMSSATTSSPKPVPQAPALKKSNRNDRPNINPAPSQLTSTHSSP
jgi:DNA-binding HxlR family transcriptional regulator